MAETSYKLQFDIQLKNQNGKKLIYFSKNVKFAHEETFNLTLFAN